jgi:polysaccharide deacetylase 2 family uncharacterized protein YibQ
VLGFGKKSADLELPTTSGGVLSPKVFGITLGGLIVAFSLAVGGMSFVVPPLPVPPVSEGTITLPKAMAAQEEISPPSASTPDPQGETPTPPLEETPPPTHEQANVQAPVEDSIAGLAETTDYGMLPQIRKEDGLTPFKAYQASFAPRAGTKALVSLVMVDFGLSSTSSLSALNNLPKGITYVVSPYTLDLQSWVTRARERGSEVWLSLPLQTRDYPNNDSGPLTVLAGSGEDANKARLLSALGKATGYPGVLLTGSPSFDTDKAGLDSVFASLAERGLGVVQADPQDRLTSSYATQKSLPFIQATHWIDTSLEKEKVEARLQQIEKDAIERRTTIAFFHPYPSLLDHLTGWKKELEAKGIELAPLSAAITNK